MISRICTSFNTTVIVLCGRTASHALHGHAVGDQLNPTSLLLSGQIFPRREQNFTSEGICSWVFQHQESVLRWLQPPGTKSTLLEQELSKGPALLLFMPHDPRSSEDHPTLKQVSVPRGVT